MWRADGQVTTGERAESEEGIGGWISYSATNVY